MTDPTNLPPEIDTSVAHSARVWNYWLGGKDWFDADKKAGDAYRDKYPLIETFAQESRGFLVRTVGYLAEEAGIRQFLDLGAGLPTADNTHQVAQRIAPESRVVYVDHDPLVLLHVHAQAACRVPHLSQGSTGRATTSTGTGGVGVVRGRLARRAEPGGSPQPSGPVTTRPCPKPPKRANDTGQACHRLLQGVAGISTRSGTPRTTRRRKTHHFEVRDAVEWELVTDDFLSDTGS